MAKPARAHAGHYLGSVLDLFAEARSWKGYWSRHPWRWIQGRVPLPAGQRFDTTLFAPAHGFLYSPFDAAIGHAKSLVAVLKVAAR